MGPSRSRERATSYPTAGGRTFYLFNEKGGGPSHNTHPHRQGSRNWGDAIPGLGPGEASVRGESHTGERSSIDG